MATEAPAAAPKPKGKKMLIIIIAVVLVLVAGGGAAAFLLLKKKGDAEAEGGGEGDAPKAAKVDPKVPPVFQPIDNMVVNLADPGGGRFAQIGITLQVKDLATADQIKSFMPGIRNGILLILSQRTTEELLQIQGKEQLAQDITNEISRQLGYPAKDNPIHAVLFSSFIIQ